MKKITLLCLFLAATTTFASAGDKKESEHNHDYEQEQRYRLEDKYIALNNLVIQLQYDYARHLSQKDQTINDLEKKMAAMESDLFQTTQSLRNLELEVWDLKKSSKAAPKSDD